MSDLKQIELIAEKLMAFVREDKWLSAASKLVDIEKTKSAITYQQLISCFEDKVIELNRPKFIYYMASIKGANVQKLEDAIIATKDKVNIQRFANYVAGANKQRLKDAYDSCVDTEGFDDLINNIK